MGRGAEGPPRGERCPQRSAGPAGRGGAGDSRERRGRAGCGAARPRPRRPPGSILTSFAPRFSPPPALFFPFSRFSPAAPAFPRWGLGGGGGMSAWVSARVMAAARQRRASSAEGRRRLPASRERGHNSPSPQAGRERAGAGGELTAPALRPRAGCATPAAGTALKPGSAAPGGQVGGRPPASPASGVPRPPARPSGCPGPG